MDYSRENKMNLELVKLSKEYKDLFYEMMDEWMSFDDYNRSPSVIRRYDYHDFNSYVDQIDRKEEIDGYPKNSVFFCIDRDKNKMIGAVDLRLYMTANTCHDGGHIGDGIRPSERGKGYGTAVMGLALEKCKEYGINKVLITCNKDNIASKKAIINNGGIYEYDITDEDGTIEERYWVTLFEETIETDRLLLRREMPGDYREVVKFLGDPRVCEYLTLQPITDLEQEKLFLEGNDPNSRSTILMIIKSKEDGHTIGSISLRESEEDIWEFGYSICYDDWNKGYTTEACKALMDYAAKNYNAKHFSIQFCEENIGSKRIAEKLGYKYQKDTEYSKRDNSRTYKAKIYTFDI